MILLFRVIFRFHVNFLEGTFLKTNISPQNGWLEDEISFQNGPFSGESNLSQVLCVIRLHPRDTADGVSSPECPEGKKPMAVKLQKFGEVQDLVPALQFLEVPK